VLASGDGLVVQFLMDMQEQTASHFTGRGLWRHGYWRMQEAHHGTEYFELFLGFMSRVAPRHPTTTAQLVDVAEHMGNWNTGVPDWFDYSTGLFRSLYFGTDGVRADESELNMPDHLRCANVLMLAHKVTQDSKYLELADSSATRWADAVCRQDAPLPIGITCSGGDPE